MASIHHLETANDKLRDFSCVQHLLAGVAADEFFNLTQLAEVSIAAAAAEAATNRTGTGSHAPVKPAQNERRTAEVSPQRASSRHSLLESFSHLSIMDRIFIRSFKKLIF